jgi:hypothetical protein
LSRFRPCDRLSWGLFPLWRSTATKIVGNYLRITYYCAAEHSTWHFWMFCGSVISHYFWCYWTSSTSGYY